MLTRELSVEEKDDFNKVVTHPLQSWEWGAFRQKTGVVVRRFGNFEKNKLVSGFQIFFHSIPKTPYTIGYLPKGPLPKPEDLLLLGDIAKNHNCIFIKLEPNIQVDTIKDFSPINFARPFKNLRPSAKSLFTRYTFVLDLTKSEDELMKLMKDKTRYNIRLAQKKGVVIKEDNSETAFNRYLELTQQTTLRQQFYAHNKEYHRMMWHSLHPDNQGMAHLFTATYQNTILTTWIVLLFNNILYYPYGASSLEFRDVMANNLMLWETALWGKKQNATSYDLWGSLGPNPNPKDPWYGFHRFKEGYNPELVEFVGSYDLVLNPSLYSVYNLADKAR